MQRKKQKKLIKHHYQFLLITDCALVNFYNDYCRSTWSNGTIMIGCNGKKNLYARIVILSFVRGRSNLWSRRTQLCFSVDPILSFLWYTVLWYRISWPVRTLSGLAFFPITEKLCENIDQSSRYYWY